MEKNQEISSIRLEFDKDIESVNELETIEKLKVKYLGKNGLVTNLTKDMASLSIEERKVVGASANEIRNYITSKLSSLEEKLRSEELNRRLEKDKIDVTLPGTKVNTGSIHPLTKMSNLIEEIFVSMGYDVVDGPELECDKYNFEFLNVSKDHPARDSQDTFYVDDEMLLRTQTSAVQVRVMLANKEKTPIRVLCPGKVFRRDDDATHSHQFMQIEGLVVDENISLADLKGTLETVLRKIFGSDRTIRFRPSYFPFTEPSFEVDISCFKCGGKGCSLCKNTGFIEVLGSGMVHPNVLRYSGYDPDKYTGFAFGAGVDRLAMLKYGISNIKDIYNNDLRFLDNFNRIEGGDKDEAK